MCADNRPSCACPDTTKCHNCGEAIVIATCNAPTCPACDADLCVSCYDKHVYSDPCFTAIRPPQLRMGRR